MITLYCHQVTGHSLVTHWSQVTLTRLTLCLTHSHTLTLSLTSLSFSPQHNGSQEGTQLCLRPVPVGQEEGQSVLSSRPSSCLTRDPDCIVLYIVRCCQTRVRTVQEAQQGLCLQHRREAQKVGPPLEPRVHPPVQPCSYFLVVFLFAVAQEKVLGRGLCSQPREPSPMSPLGPQSHRPPWHHTRGHTRARLSL